MKNILIVEDTQVNIDAAKTYFANISGSNFIYVSSKQDAENEILKGNIDAVITDRSIPYAIGEDTPSKERRMIRMNGYSFLGLVAQKKIPVIMISQHGDTEFLENYIPESVFDFNNYNYSGNEYYNYEILKEISRHLGGDEIKQYVDGVGYSKSNHTGWKLAFDYIQSQF